MGWETWRSNIITFETEKTFSNPFLDMDLAAEFLGPAGEKIRREAYWDGGKIYRIAFAPVTAGEWSYRLSCTADPSLDGRAGSLQAEPYAGTKEIYRHGFLKTAGMGRYLAYRDGMPFFWLGDTHWGFVSGERWDESNHPKMDSQFKGMADRRVEQEFTVYQTNLHCGFSGPHYWMDGQEGKLPDVVFYQKEVDRRMHYLADAGFVNALGFGWAGGIIGHVEEYKALARYVIARYGALPIVWTLGGEAAGYQAQTRQAGIDGWREIALEIERLDGYRHLRTVHYTNERPFASYYQKEGWFDFTLNQAGHGDYPIRAEFIKEHRKNYPEKPFVEGEALYEGVYTLEENGSRKADAYMVRRAAYLTMQCGGCGYTYGAQGIWNVLWERTPGMKQGMFGNQTWAEAIDAPGANHMTYMKRLYEREHFEELFPAPGCYETKILFSDEALFGMFLPLVTANADTSRILLYYTAGGRNSGNGAKLRYLADCPYEAEWFNPRTGEYSVAQAGIRPDRGTWETPEKPDEEDWVMVVRKKADSAGR